MDARTKSQLDQKPAGLLRQLRNDEPLPVDLLLLADETIAVIDKYIHECDIFVYEKNNEIIAQYSLQTLSAEEAEIKNIAVSTAYQDMGIGKMLLTDAVSRAKRQGAKYILIGTGDVMFKQLNLYEKMGFKRFDIRKRYYLDNYPEPLFENGLQLKDMVVLRQVL